MLRTIDVRGRELTTAQWLAAVPAPKPPAPSPEAAFEIVDDVRCAGSGVAEQAARFDRVEDHAIRVPAAHLDEALERLDPQVRRAIEEMIRRVRLASAAQVPARGDRDRPGAASNSAGSLCAAPVSTCPAARRCIRRASS
jgi:histidinol dehydrogenase